LPRKNREDGHQVQIIASCETYIKAKKLGYVPPSSYITEDGIPICRLAYRRGAPGFAKRKLRMHSGLMGLLEDFSPDVILFHGICGWELLTVAKYKTHHPNTRLYADTHTDAHNSARSLISKHILHRLYYRTIVRLALPHLDRVLFTTPETGDFARRNYGIPDTAMEYFPLGGEVYPDRLYGERRTETRRRIGLCDEDILVLQAGKLERRKKVLESIRAFREREREGLRLVLVGSVGNDIADELDSLLQDAPSISYLGWQHYSVLMDYLCAADVYLQPGSQSAIMQSAVCLRCPVVLDDVPSHRALVRGNGWLLNGSLSLSNVLDEVARKPGELRDMSARSLHIGKTLLDYKKLAARLYR